MAGNPSSPRKAPADCPEARQQAALRGAGPGCRAPSDRHSSICFAVIHVDQRAAKSQGLRGWGSKRLSSHLHGAFRPSNTSQAPREGSRCRRRIEAQRPGFQPPLEVEDTRRPRSCCGSLPLLPLVPPPHGPTPGRTLNGSVPGRVGHPRPPCAFSFWGPRAQNNIQPMNERRNGLLFYTIRCFPVKHSWHCC